MWNYCPLHTILCYNLMLVWIWANTDCDLWPGPPLHLLHCVAHLKHLSVSSKAELHTGPPMQAISSLNMFHMYCMFYLPTIIIQTFWPILNQTQAETVQPILNHTEVVTIWPSLNHAEVVKPSLWSVFDLYHLCVYKHSILRSYVHCIDPNSLTKIFIIHHATWFIFW